MESIRPLKLMIEVPGDLETLRRVLVRLAGRLESRQPGIIRRIEEADLSLPMKWISPTQMPVRVAAEPGDEKLVIKVDIEAPPRIKTNFRAWFWRWRIRVMTRLLLRSLRIEMEREARALPANPG
jgi:hypothetical protein